jgi:hypothetical protein
MLVVFSRRPTNCGRAAFRQTARFWHLVTAMNGSGAFILRRRLSFAVRKTVIMNASTSAGER